MDFAFLAKTPFFRTLRTEEIKSALTCLGAVTRHFEKGSYIHRAGDKVHTVSLILKGCVNIAYDDIWGNRTILGQAHSGEIFAEAYACTGRSSCKPAAPVACADQTRSYPGSVL